MITKIKKRGSRRSRDVVGKKKMKPTVKNTTTRFKVKIQRVTKNLNA